MIDSTVRSDWVHTVRATLRNAKVDYHEVKPWIYWRDMLMSATIAYASAAVYLKAPAFSVWQIVGFGLAVFWLYRVGSLVHEVCHLGRHESVPYKVAWNIFVGVPTLTPSIFFTGSHRDHHTQRVYGTKQDPEYVVNMCRRGSVANLVIYFSIVLVFPLMVFLRFLLAPLTFITPSIREFSLRRLSAFTLNWRYERPLSRIDRKPFAALELLCCARAWCIPSAVLLGVVPWTHMFLLYTLGASVFMLNQLRQLADHHFEGDGNNLSLSDHIKDSCNYVGKDPITWLLFPFAIQYHALHHLFPSLPYHNLAFAHTYLMDELPGNSPYRDLVQPGWWSVAKQMLRKDPLTVAGTDVATEPENHVAVEKAMVPAPHMLSGQSPDVSSHVMERQQDR